MVNIIVNGKFTSWNNLTISYEQLQEIEKGFTVQYSKGPQGHESGTLTPHQSIFVKDRMVFDVVDTDNT